MHGYPLTVLAWSDFQEVLTLLELDDIKDDVIGPPNSGIASEQRKRLTIAVVRAPHATAS